jgi:hypothetical protein
MKIFRRDHGATGAGSDVLAKRAEARRRLEEARRADLRQSDEAFGEELEQKLRRHTA